jgi:hypothetical protein
VYSGRNSALFIAGLHKRFDTHWELTASWRGLFSKTFRNNIFSAGLGYNF